MKGVITLLSFPCSMIKTFSQTLRRLEGIIIRFAIFMIYFWFGVRCSISLKDLSAETTHNLWLPLKDAESGSWTVLNMVNIIFMAGKVHVLVTVTATEKQVFKIMTMMIMLAILLWKADGLEPKLFGKRRPFVVAELFNQRVQTRPREGVSGLEWGAGLGTTRGFYCNSNSGGSEL